MTLGSEPDLLKAATAVLSAFGEDVSGMTHIEEAERRIATHLSNKRCLVVVDDVFDVANLKLISSIGPAARAIVTTRAHDIAAAISAATFALPPLSTAEARTWMTSQGQSPDSAAQLAQKLGNLPLALELAEQTLRLGVLAEDLIKRLDDEGLTAIDTGTSGDVSASLFASLMSALEGLPQEDRRRIPMLASLPPSQPIDLTTFAENSGIGLSAAEAMARRVAAMSLITFDDANHTVSISAPVHAFLRSLQLRQDRAEANRRSRSTAVEGIIGISYRRDDAAAHASRLYDRLSQRFGFDRVFVDIDAILPGEDFVQAIRRRIDEAAAWLVVIGPNWANSTNSRGERRLNDPDDFVRIEITIALEQGIPVIPVLVAGAAMPRSNELPPELQELVRRQAITLDHSGFHQGVDQLIYALEHLGAYSRPTRLPTEATLDQATLRPIPFSQNQSAKMQVFQRGRRRLISTMGAAAALVLVILLGVGLQHRSTLLEGTAPVIDPAAPSALATAIFEKAEAYYFGRGVRQNYKEAAALYEQAASDGFAPAENALGRMYENGIGVSKDLDRALQYYQRAASKGHPDAKAALARLESK
jgi:TIR domain/Sel1 repeat/NB-ARC domain